VGGVVLRTRGISPISSAPASAGTAKP
jgi:hypothetical protein